MSIILNSLRAPSRESLLPLHSADEKRPSLLLAQFVATLHPRRSKLQASLLALLSLMLLTTYVFLVHYPDASAPLAMRGPVKAPASQLTLALESIRKSSMVAIPHVEASAEQIRLTNTQELAAVSSFLASLPQNQIPSFVDPSSPLDPQLVLDFDVRSPRAAQEVEAMVEEVWSTNPVFLYSKRHSSASRDIKSLLDGFNLKPSPTIIDVDMRDDADILIPLLHRLTSTREFPVLIIGGHVVATVEEVHQMEQDGTLRQMIVQSGALIDGAKKKH